VLIHAPIVTSDEPASATVGVAILRTTESNVAVVFDRVSLAFDEQIVLRDVSFEIPRGAMRILLGDSGAGKSVLLKLILGLLRPDAGAIYVHGQRVDTMSERDLLRVRADIGMLFQENALFDSLTVDENVGYSGTGSFTQSGGTNDVTGKFTGQSKTPPPAACPAVP